MFLYNTGIFIAGFYMKATALFNRKAKLWIQGRKDIFRRLREAISPTDRIVWVHCASLGEFEQGRPIIESIRQEHPDFKILLTFFSPSGYEIRKDYDKADYVFYLPLDTRRNVRRFLDIAKPEITIFVKYEFWLNYLRELRKRELKVYLVSAIFRRDSIFFRWYGGMFRRALKTYKIIFVQNKESKQLLSGLDIADVTVSGDTRFDRVAAVAKNARKLEIIEKFAGGSQVFVAGSTWPADEEIIVELIGRFPDLKLIIAPHEIGDSRIEKLLELLPADTVRYTQTDGSGISETRVMIVDTIGILSSVYKYADFAYIGGGFGVGIHNTLEAAAFGTPIAFGPNYQRFKEARDLIKIGAAQIIENEEELYNWLHSLAGNPLMKKETGEKAREYVASNTGATKKIMDSIFG